MELLVLTLQKRIYQLLKLNNDMIISSSPKVQEISGQLLHLSDVNFQRQEWTDHIKSTWFFPEEIMSMWFDDIMRRSPHHLVDAKILSENELAILLKVSNVLEKFFSFYELHSESLYGIALLDNSLWLHVIQTAQQSILELKTMGWIFEDMN